LKDRNRNIHFILYKNLDKVLIYLLVEVAVMEAVVVAAVVGRWWWRQ
jgi:hypothetical protein